MTADSSCTVWLRPAEPVGLAVGVGIGDPTMPATTGHRRSVWLAQSGGWLRPLSVIVRSSKLFIGAGCSA